jgi:acyl-CoA thioesterase
LRERLNDTHVRFTAGPDWGQGRTLFGGLLSALSVVAMRDVCGQDWPLRALQTSFVGPVAPGVFEIQVILLRQGKHVRQVQALIRQNDPQGQSVVAGVLLAVFGNGRESSLPLLTPIQRPTARSVQEATALPFMPGLTPNFVQHVDFRLAEGSFPFTGADSWSDCTYVRVNDSQGLDSELLSVILADVGPTPALSRLKAPAPASSVSWALELRPVPDVDLQAHWRTDRDTLAAGEGYVNDRTLLWTPDGRLAALGYQVQSVYA